MSEPKDATPREEILLQAEYLERLAERLASDSHEAKDLLQDTWVAALARPPRRAQSPKPWLATVMRNLLRNQLRSARHEHHRLVRLASSPPRLGPRELAERRDLSRRIAAALSALEPAYRQAILLRYVEDLPPRAVAARLGIPVETVRTRLKRGLAQMRRRLDGGEGDGRKGWLQAFVALFRRRAPTAAVPVGLAARTARWAAPLAAVSIPLGTLFLIEPAPETLAVAAPAEQFPRREARPSLETSPESRRVPTLPPAEAAEARETNGSLEVELLWSDTRSPATGAGVRLEPAEELSDPEALAIEAGADGIARAPGLAPGFWTVLATSGAPREARVSPGKTTTLQLLLDPGLEVAGRVLDDRGQPVARAAIACSWPARRDMARIVASSDERGEFRVEHADPLAWIRAEKQGFAPARQVFVGGPAAARERTRTIDLHLVGPARTVTCLVEDEAGRPVEGATVRAGFRFDPRRDERGQWICEFPASWLTDGSGAFSMEVGPLEATPIAITAPGFAPLVTRAHARSVAARRFRLARESAIEGTVLGLDGLPVGAGVPVVAEIAGELGGVATRTGPDGTFRLGGLPPQSVRLTASLGDRTEGSGRAELELGSGATARVAIRLGREGRIAGVVRDGNGALLVGRAVTLEEESRGWVEDYRFLLVARPTVRRARTDARGSFVLEGCESVPHVVRVLPEGGGETPCAWAFGVRPCDAALELRAQEGEVCASSWIVGKVEGEERNAASGVQVLAQTPLLEGVLRAAVDPATGRFEIGPLLAGEYAVGLWPEHGEARCVARVELGPGEVRDLGPVAANRTGSLRLIVRTEDGAAPRRVFVQVATEQSRIRSQSKEAWMQRTPDERGAIVIGDLVACDHGVKVRVPGYALAARKARIAPGAETAVEVTLRAGVTVELEIEIPARAEAEAGLRIGMRGPDGLRREAGLEPLARGERVLRGKRVLAPGAYEVEVVGASGWSARGSFEVEEGSGGPLPVRVVLD